MHNVGHLTCKKKNQAKYNQIPQENKRSGHSYDFLSFFVSQSYLSLHDAVT